MCMSESDRIIRKISEEARTELVSNHRKWLQSEGSEGVRAKLDGADLSGTHLGGLYLRKASLKNANLSGANLWSAKLGEADLRGADLSGANLIGVELRGANLSEANISNAYLKFFWVTLALSEIARRLALEEPGEAPSESVPRDVHA